MVQKFTDDDRGKTVTSADGTQVGTVDRVENGTAHVRQDDSSSLTDKIKSALGWDDSDETHTLQYDNVESKDDNNIHLRSF